MTSARRIVILGGTLDPPHIGHVSVLEQVRDALGAEVALLVPSSQPPHRAPAMASPEDRREMATAAAAGHDRLSVDDIEVRRGGASFTIDSLDEWERRRPEDEVQLILGADAARGIAGWHRVAELMQRAHWVIVNRSNQPRINVAEARGLGFNPERTRLLGVVSPDVSATEIRRRRAAGQSISGLVDPAVEAIIAQRGLYRSPAAQVDTHR